MRGERDSGHLSFTLASQLSNRTNCAWCLDKHGRGVCVKRTDFCPVTTIRVASTQLHGYQNGKSWFLNSFKKNNFAAISRHATCPQPSDLPLDIKLKRVCKCSRCLLSYTRARGSQEQTAPDENLGNGKCVLFSKRTYKNCKALCKDEVLCNTGVDAVHDGTSFLPEGDQESNFLGSLEGEGDNQKCAVHKDLVKEMRVTVKDVSHRFCSSAYIHFRFLQLSPHCNLLGETRTLQLRNT